MTRELVVFRVTCDRYCYRVTLTCLGVSRRLSFPLATGFRTANARTSISLAAMFLRNGWHGFSDYEYQHPRRGADAALTQRLMQRDEPERSIRGCDLSDQWVPWEIGG